jgi:hypothetical protein
MFITTLEYGKNTDVYLELEYLGPTLSGDDIFFIIEFSTVPYTIKNVVNSVEHECLLSNTGGEFTNYSEIAVKCFTF